MLSNCIPTDGPHVPEQSVYYENFKEMMQLLPSLPGFGAEDSEFSFESESGNVYFQFSENVIRRIIEPEKRKNEKGDCQIAKSFKRVEIFKGGFVRVCGASDSVHALYIALALFVSRNVPKKKRARQDENEHE